MIRLRVFGALDLRSPDGRELRSVLAQPKRTTLLVYLALTAGAHRRDKLLALFWPEQDAERARNALSQAVHFLRRAIGDDALSSTGDELALERSTFWCDASAFEEALDSGRLADAADLYRGDLLDGFHLANAPELERWMEAERARLAGRFATALESLAADCESRGEPQGAVTHWRRLAARDPYNSRIALRLIKTMAAAGDRGGAVNHARIHETLLRSELDTAPPADIAAFLAQLRAGPQVRSVPASPETSLPVAGATLAAARTHSEPRHGSPRRIRLASLAAAAVIIAISLAASTWISTRGGALPPKESQLRALILRARAHEANRSQIGLATAKSAYERAIQYDSSFAPAYAGLAMVHELMALYGLRPATAARDSARVLALRAVALDSNSADAHNALGYSLSDAMRFDEAEREFRTAIRLDPADARTRLRFGTLLLALGRGTEAVGQLMEAQRLDADAPRGVVIMLRSAQYVATGQRTWTKQPAGARWTEFLKREPGEPWAYRADAFDLAEVGRCTEARNQIAHTSRLAPGAVQTLIAVAMVERWCGQPRRALELMQEAKRNPRARDFGGHFANAHGAFGDVDSAFAWLSKTNWTIDGLADLRGVRWLDSIRPDPRYPQLLRSLGLARN